MFPETDQKTFKNQKLLIGHLRLTISIGCYVCGIIIYVIHCNGQRAYLAFARSLTHYVCVSSFPSGYLGRLCFLVNDLWRYCICVCLWYGRWSLQSHFTVLPWKDSIKTSILALYGQWFSKRTIVIFYEWLLAPSTGCTQNWISLQPILDSSGSACVHAPWRIWRTYFMGLQSLQMHLAIFCT